MGCLGGMGKISCTRLVLDIWSFAVYFSGKRRRVLVNTKRNVLMPPGHPIILLKF